MASDAVHGLNAVSAIFCLAALAFFIVGCIAFTNEEQALKRTAWIVSDRDSFEASFGLRSFNVKVDIDVGGATLVSSENTQKYDSGSCSGNFCDVCEKMGKAAFALTVVATVFTAISLAMSLAAMAVYEKGTQVGNVFMAFIAAVTATIAVAIFENRCWNELNSDAGGEDNENSLDLKWGNGAILTLVGLLLMWLVFVFQIAAAATRRDGPNDVPRNNVPPAMAHNTATNQHPAV